MLIELIFFIAIGVLAGTATGLIPGIHVNLIGAFILTLPTLIFANPLYSTVFIVAMAITHTFIDFIPSTFLGCPDSDTELSVLPSHKLLKISEGYRGINLSNKGSLIGIILFSIIIIPSIFILPKIFNFIKTKIPYLLILVAIILILTEQKKLSALKVFLLTGALGLSANALSPEGSLLPLLSGLFGASNIILSLKSKTKIPTQLITTSKINPKKPIISALIGAPLCSFLPGLGSGQAAIIGNSLNKNSEEEFIVLIGIINTLVMAFSFITLYSLNKTRTGAALTIKNILFSLSINHIILIAATIILSGIIAFFTTNFLGKIVATNIKKIKYSYLSFVTLFILILIILIFSKLSGIFILLISTLTGIYSIKQKVKRTNMMGALIIPTILWYLF